MPPRLSVPHVPSEQALSARQAACRRRIVAAASELATRGYDRCQMRAVAATAGVAASTVYLYFPSKDDLLLACLQRWLSNFEATSTRQRSDLTPHARLLAVASALTGELAQIPQLADAMIRPYLYAQGAAAEGADAVRRQMTRIFLAAMDVNHREVHQPMAELFTDVCMTNIPAITHRRTSVSQLMQRLARAAAPLIHVDVEAPTVDNADSLVPQRFSGDAMRECRTLEMSRPG